MQATLQCRRLDLREYQTIHAGRARIRSGHRMGMTQE
jgi:hypothetical protein